MAIPVQMPIELYDAQGSSSTRMVMVSDRLIEVEGETTRVQGQELDFEFALVGHNRILRGRAMVEKVSDPEFGRGRCTLRILELDRELRTTFMSWLYDLTLGGGRPAPMSRPASSPGRRIPSATGRPGPDLSSSTLADGSGIRPTGRAAMTSALTRQGSRPTKPEAPKATRSRKRHRIEVRVAAGAKPPMVKVRYNDPKRFNEHYQTHLQHGTVKLRYVESGLSEGMQVSVRLYLPNGALISCPARVSAATTMAIALDLQLSASDRSTLGLSAGERRGHGRSRG